MDLVLFGKTLEKTNAHPESYTKEYLGSKGMNLLTMAKAGFNVPPAAIIPVYYCNEYHASSDADKHALVDKAVLAVMDAIAVIEETLGKQCLYSVRSGAQVSMPGMMDTILNVGVGDEGINMSQQLNGAIYFDCLRRFYQMYGSVVMGVPSEVYEDIILGEKNIEGVTEDSELTTASLMEICKLMEDVAPVAYPETLVDQLLGSIRAVWDSWNTDRAITYRNLHNISHDLGTGVIIQAMVYGNLNDSSGSGVMFTRNPTNGENIMYGDFLVNAQGEDVVAGVRTPDCIHSIKVWDEGIYDALGANANKLEEVYQDMQDIEFTVENGQLWILQTRTGKRTASASFVIAHDLLEEGWVSQAEAFKMLSANDYYLAQQPLIDPEFDIAESATGIPAGGGIVSGAIVFSSDAAVAYGKGCILVTKETTPEDIAGMAVAYGILTKIGGVTSHAAVVARSMDTTCVVGCGSMQFTSEGLNFSGGDTLQEGSIITIDGNTGKVWESTVPVIKPELTKELLYFKKLAFGSQDVIPVGKTHKQSVNNRIAIPYSLYGPENVTEWADNVKEADFLGYEIYISLRHPTALANSELLSLFGKVEHNYSDKELLEMLGESAEACKRYEPHDTVSLEAVLEGTYIGTPSLDEIQAVFGTKKSYNHVIKLLKAAGEFKMPVLPKAKVTILKETFVKEG